MISGRCIRLLGRKASRLARCLSIEATAGTASGTELSPDWSELRRPLGQPSPATHPHLMRPEEATPGISRAEYAARRRVLVHALQLQLKQAQVAPGPLLLLLKAPAVTYSAPDVPNVFRQCSNFLYLSGFREPGAVLAVYTTEVKTPLTWPDVVSLSDQGTSMPSFGGGPRAGCDGAAALTGIQEVESLDSFPPFISSLCQGQRTRLLFLSGDPTQQPIFAKAMAKGSLVHTSIDPANLVHQLRWTKSEAEVRLMSEAGRIGALAMTAAVRESLARTASGVQVSEGELGSRMELEGRREGALGLAYPPVIAGSNRANTIHYIDNDALIEPWSLVLVDSGVDYHGYVSDITRTWAPCGHPTDADRSLHEALEEAHKSLLRIAAERRPLSLSTLYQEMLVALGKQLQRLGLLPSGASPAQARREAEKACPHHVSHWLGMDVHDAASVHRGIDIQPGVAFTIEPGFYFPANRQDIPPEFRGLGIRLEDDVVATESGLRLPSAPLPTNLEELHALSAN